MKTLLLDSTYKDLNVGLNIDGEMHKISYECFQRQSELMISEIDKILKENNVNPKEINEIVVTHGPGSFTGLRIALTIAKVYCYAVKCPCFSLSSLNVLMKKDETSICLLNARSGRSYFAVYKNNEVIKEDQILTNDKVLEYVNNHPNYVVCGDTEYLGIEGYKADLIDNMYSLKNENNKVKDIYTLKAVYLKD
jgi:tRNA threonylcarbamoyladenosine biosynthesis protein TsaB